MITCHALKRQFTAILHPVWDCIALGLLFLKGDKGPKLHYVTGTRLQFSCLEYIRDSGPGWNLQYILWNTHLILLCLDYCIYLFVPPSHAAGKTHFTIINDLFYKMLILIPNTPKQIMINKLTHSLLWWWIHNSFDKQMYLSNLW